MQRSHVRLLSYQRNNWFAWSTQEKLAINLEDIKGDNNTVVFGGWPEKELHHT